MVKTFKCVCIFFKTIKTLEENSRGLRTKTKQIKNLSRELSIMVHSYNPSTWEAEAGGM
jgi:hypothetical protein